MISTIVAITHVTNLSCSRDTAICSCSALIMGTGGVVVGLGVNQLGLQQRVKEHALYSSDPVVALHAIVSLAIKAQQDGMLFTR